MSSCSYAITRTLDDRVVRIFQSERDAREYIKYDTHNQYRAERVFYQPYADHPQVFLVAFVDRPDDPSWDFRTLLSRGKLQRVRKIKTSHRAIREYAFGTSRKKAEEDRLKALEQRVLRQGFTLLNSSPHQS